MSWAKTNTQQAFTFHFILSVIAMLVLNVCDIMMWRAGAITVEGAKTVVVPNTSIELLPYHFWVMSVLWFTLNGIIAVTYFFYTKDLLGGGVLMSVGMIYSLLGVQDILFFYYQGRADSMPQNWTWLYWQNEVFGASLPLFTVLVMACIGVLAIFGLFAFRFHMLKK